MPARLTIAIAAGDGIGPEISAATRKVLDAAIKRFDLDITFQEVTLGLVALQRDGSTFPEAAFEKISACDGLILGPVSHNEYPPPEEGGVNPSGALRKRLDLYANIRPARTRPGVTPGGRYPLNLVIVRENTEGFYADRCLFQGPGEFMPDPDMVLSLRRVTRDACMRIAHTAFEEAVRRKAAGTGSGRVTAVHKANVLRVGDGLFLECVRKVAAKYDTIDYDERLVDAMCALLVREPMRYDVICSTNMFGDILSDLASELAGGLGLAASLNVGADRAMAQAQHGSAPEIAGQDIANPCSLIGSAAMLLDWMGSRHGNPALNKAAHAIDAAIAVALLSPESRTKDLDGQLGTAAFAEKVAQLVMAAGA